MVRRWFSLGEGRGPTPTPTRHPPPPPRPRHLPPKQPAEFFSSGWGDSKLGASLSGRRPEPEAPKSGHARGPMPLGGLPWGRRPQLGRQHPASNSASEGHHVLGTSFIAKNALFPTEIGLLDAFFGCPTRGPKNDPGEHHRVYLLTFAEDALLMFFGGHRLPQRTPTRARIMSISGLSLWFRMRLRAWKPQKTL